MAAFADSLRDRFRHWKQLKRVQSIYNPVDSSRKEIRLLEVYLPSSERMVECRVKYASLLDPQKPKYETISYCWGDPAFTSKVLLDGKAVYVPRNTELALRNVVSPGCSRTIWQDFLCINQNDIAERSQQVAIMGEIYSFSQGNLIYHGPTQLSDKFLADIRKINEDIEDTIGPNEDLQDFMEGIPGATYFRADSSIHWALLDTLDQQELLKFFESPWFIRVWIWQEILVAPSIKIFCNASSRFALDNILRAAIWLYHYHRPHVSRSLKLSDGLCCASNLWAHRRNLQRGQSSITDLLRNPYSRKATDERDKVFAILGVTQRRHSNREVQDLLLPDYNKSLRNVYRDATRYVIEEMGSMTLLAPISHRNQEEVMGVDFPSWTVRFDRDRLVNGDSRAFLVRSISLEGIERGCDELISLADSLDSDTLGSWGWQLDVIQSLSVTYNYDFWGLQNVAASYQFFRQILDEFGGTADNHTTLTTLSRTLLANANARGEKSHISDWNGLTLLIEDLRTGKVPVRSRHLTSAADSDEVTVSHYREALINSFFSRRLTKTKNGYLGLVPKMSEPENIIAVLKWSPWPAVLRPRSDGYYSFVGFCYIDELRDSRMIDLIDQENIDWVHYKIR